MKLRWLTLLSVILNAALAGTLAFVLAQPRAVVAPARPVRAAPIPERAAEIHAVAAPAGEPANTRPWTWGDLASTNFFAYRDNLRAVGCPEKTVRDILEREINDYYVRRRQPALDAFQPTFWESLARFGSKAGETLEKDLESLDQERREAIARVLGGQQPDTAAESASRRESYAERYQWLPPEMQSQLVDLEEQLWQQNHALQQEISKRDNSQWTKEDHEKRKEFQDQFQRARKEALGPWEGEFELRNSNAANWASGLAGFEATEDEWRAVSRIKKEQELALQSARPAMDVNLLKRYGLLQQGAVVNADGSVTLAGGAHVIPPASGAAGAKPRDFEAEIQQVLGADRFSDYQRAGNGDYQQTRRVTQRLGLNDAVAAQAWEIQRAAQGAAQQLRAGGGVAEERIPAALMEIQAEAERSLRTTLGGGFDVYHEYAGSWLNGLAPGE